MSYSDTLQQQGYNAAVANGVPPQLFNDVITAESGWNPNAINPSSGATGIAQFLPSTAANPGYGVTPFDPTNPQASLTGAAQYLAGLFNATGSWSGALNAYSGNTSGSAAYPGNQAIASDLQGLAGSAGGASPSAGSTSGSCGLSPACWLAGIGSWAGGYASRAGLILLAIILLIGGVMLFAMRTQVVQDLPAS